MNVGKNRMGASSEGVLLALCVIVWSAILVATLWPFNPLPRNEVSWLGTTNGIHFGEKGLVVSSSPFSMNQPGANGAFTLELWLRIQNEYKVNTILSFYGAEKTASWKLRQYNDSLIVSHTLESNYHPARGGQMDVDHIFHTDRPTLLTIASDKTRTNVYADGALVQSSSTFAILGQDFAGNLVLGTSPVDYEPWSGDVQGLAFYGRELNAAEVQEHFREWQVKKTVPLLAAEAPIAIFPFAERAGALLHNAVLTEPGLEIPAHFYLPQKPMLRRPWREFSGDWNYVADIFRNIVGFVPLGMVFYLYLAWGRGSSRAGLITVLLGAATSLMIEILQAFIPMRYSGMTDIITNTFGTAVGVFLVESKPVRLVLDRIARKQSSG